MWICERCVKCTGCTPQLIRNADVQVVMIYLGLGLYSRSLTFINYVLGSATGETHVIHWLIKTGQPKKIVCFLSNELLKRQLVN